MNAKRKITHFILTFTFISISIFAFLGEYFFHYALVNNGNKAKGSKRNISSIVSKSNQEIIETNKKVATNATSSWLNSTRIEKISELSYDNLVLWAAQFRHHSPTDKYAIIIHGYSNTKDDFYDIAQNYYEQGFNVIAPDLRAHGESDGKYIGMGWLDKEDIKLWIKRIIDINNEARIVIHGVSMGAATAMMVSGDNLPKNVKAIIEDCGYSSVRDIFSSELKARFNLPPFPLIELLTIATNIHAKYNISDASCINQVKKSTIPLLVLHGDKDNFVPISMAYQIYNSANKNKDILIFNGAGHNECRFLEPDKYYKKVFDFIKLNI